MKKLLFVSLVPVIVVILAQCASMPEKWPTHERMAEDRMLVIQRRIGDGLKTGALTPNQAQVLLAKLEDIRRDYSLLRDRPSSRDEWERLLNRLDVLENETDRALAHPTRIETMRVEDRIITLQRRIDHGRVTGRLTRAQGREFQLRLDAIRSDFFRLTEDRFFTQEEREDISRRLDLLERDLSRLW